MLAEGRLGDRKLVPALLGITPAEGGYDVDLELGFGDDGGVQVAGFVPWDPDPGTPIDQLLAREGLDLILGGKGVPLGVFADLFPDEIQDGVGRLTAHGPIRGSLADPEPDLAATLTGGGFLLVRTGVKYGDAALDLHLTRNLLEVRKLSVATADHTEVTKGGDGSMTGSLRAERDGAVSGSLSLSNATVLDLPERHIRLSGGIALFGNWPHIGARSTDLILDTGRIILPEQFFWESNDLALPIEFTVVRTAGVVPRGAEAEAGIVPAWLDLDVAVSLNRAGFVDVTMPMEQTFGQLGGSLSTLTVQTQVDGELKVRSKDGELDLSGEIRPVRGKAGLLGNNFDISDDSIIAVTGRDWARPVLDIRAVRQGSYGDIEVHVSGTPDLLAIDFTSAEYAIDDILSILLIGRPLGELDAGGGDQSGLVQAAVAALLRAQLAEAGAATNLRYFSYDAESGLQAGAKLGRRVFFIAGWNPGVDPVVPKDNVYEVTVEWQTGMRWQLEFTTGDNRFSDWAWYKTWKF